MVSSPLSCWPVRVRLASRPGLLLLLGEGNNGDDEDGEAENKNLQTDANDGQDALLSADASSQHKKEKGFVPSEADNKDLLPHEGPESDGDLCKIGGDHPKSGDLCNDGGDPGKEKEGFAPIADQGFIPVVSEKEKMGFAPYKDQTAFGPADGKLGNDPIAADAEGPDPAPEKGSVHVQTMASDPEDAADGYDVEPDAPTDGEDDECDDEMGLSEILSGALLLEFDESAESARADEDFDAQVDAYHDVKDAADAAAYASITDAKAHVAHADESDAEEHTAEDDFAADAVDGDFDDSNDYESGDAEHADAVVAVSFTEPVDDDCASTATTDEFDADFAEDAAAADAYASLADAEEDESDSSDQDDEEDAESDAETHAATDEKYAVDAAPDEEYSNQDKSDADSAGPHEDRTKSADYISDEGTIAGPDMHAVKDGALLKISSMMGMHTALQEPVIYCHDYDDATTHQAKPRVDPKVKKKTSLLLCITINMPFHLGEHVVSHETVAGHAPREGEDHVHADHVSQDEADSQDARVHDVCRFQDAAHPVVILADCSHDGMVLVAKAGTLSTYLPFPILRGSKGIYQDSEKQIEVPAKLIYAGSKKIALFTIKAPFDPG